MNDPVRAPRFALELSLRYRRLGEGDWREGRTENISRSGVLFRTDSPVQIDAPLEMSFVLPVGRIPPDVVCRGRIVRAVPPGGEASQPRLAATISEYRFARPDRRPGSSSR